VAESLNTFSHLSTFPLFFQGLNLLLFLTVQFLNCTKLKCATATKLRPIKAIMPRKNNPLKEWNNAAKKVGMPSMIESARQWISSFQKHEQLSRDYVPFLSEFLKRLEELERAERELLAAKRKRDLLQTQIISMMTVDRHDTKAVLQLIRDNPTLKNSQICDKLRPDLKKGDAEKQLERSAKIKAIAEIRRRNLKP